MINLADYRCRGFPGEFDRAMADVPVRGIDREQTLSMIRLCSDTSDILYGRFSPNRIHYHRSARPALETIAREFSGDVMRAMRWTAEHVRHPDLAGHVPPDRALDEEALIASRVGWCNEQCRVFIALCEVMEIPARLCFCFHRNLHTAHTATEVFLDGRWAFHDVTYGVRVPLRDGTLAEARQIMRDPQVRELASQAYREPLRRYKAARLTPPGERWPSCEIGGDYLFACGIANYLIKGVEAVHD